MLTLLVGSSSAAPVCSGGTCTETFIFTGGAQTWTVPTGVTQATFDVYGAQGGGSLNRIPHGGRGGHATADLTLTPGATVTIVVGGSGGTEDFCGAPGQQPGAGGFNGGAAGGAGSGSAFICPGSGGGGASDVRIGGSGLAARVLVAGGGGGIAPSAGVGGPANGGGGGGSNGQDGNSALLGAVLGSGGDQSGASGSGQLGDGSAGADQGTAPTAGGGGGGGYYGGAGGPTNAGGGGGSGFGPAGAVSFETGVRAGDGNVTISYTEPPSPDLTITKTHTGNFTQGQTGAQYTITVTNSGTAPTGGSVNVTDTLPTGLTATALSGTGWTCSISGPILCRRSDALAAGSSYPSLTLTVNVASDAPSSVTNSATVSGGGEKNTANNTATDPTTINQTPTAPTCNGQAATIYVNAQGVIVGGPKNGQLYGGKLTGTGGADVIVGTGGRDDIDAKAGNDVVCGGGGNDVLEAAAGNDLLFGEDGNDTLKGGGGNDTMTGGPGADKFVGGAGTDTATDFDSQQGDTKTGVEA